MELTQEESEAWDALLERALTSFDEQESERHAKRVAVAGKKLLKRGLKDVPVDKAAVVRFLVRYGECKPGEGYAKCVAASGVSKIELVTAYDLWPEAKAVYEYVRGIRAQLYEIENEDLLEDARNGLKQLLTVEGCELNAKAVLTAIERLDAKHFGNAKDAAKASGKAQVTYNCPGLTVNMIMAPSEVARRGLALEGAGEIVEAE